MGAKIVSRSLSQQGRDNWDKIFGKKQSKKKSKIIPLTVDDSDVIPMTNEEICKPADYPGNWDDAQFLNNWHTVCKDCNGTNGKHKLGCLDYDGPGDPSK